MTYFISKYVSKYRYIDISKCKYIQLSREVSTLIANYHESSYSYRLFPDNKS